MLKTRTFRPRCVRPRCHDGAPKCHHAAVQVICASPRVRLSMSGSLSGMGPESLDLGTSVSAKCVREDPIAGCSSELGFFIIYKR